MESRDSWMPKTVDQLAKTNPKMSFGGQMLGAYKPNKSGVMVVLRKIAQTHII